MSKTGEMRVLPITRCFSSLNRRLLWAKWDGSQVRGLLSSPKHCPSQQEVQRNNRDNKWANSESKMRLHSKSCSLDKPVHLAPTAGFQFTHTFPFSPVSPLPCVWSDLSFFCAMNYSFQPSCWNSCWYQLTPWLFLPTFFCPLYPHLPPKGEILSVVIIACPKWWWQNKVRPENL